MKSTPLLLCILGILSWAIPAQAVHIGPITTDFKVSESGSFHYVFHTNLSSSIDFPSNFDDIDQPSIDCESPYPTPEYIDSTFGSGGFPQGTCDSLQWTFTDSVTQICAGSYEILRYWEITDPCANENHSHIQTILVLDKTPPVVFCPQPSAIGVDTLINTGSGCMAKVLLPTVFTTDNCTSNNAITITISVDLSDGTTLTSSTSNPQGFYEFEVPPRTINNPYTFIYTATDACGNTHSCEVLKAVVDTFPPVVICAGIKELHVTDSINIVDATFFDDGMADNCTPVEITGRRGTILNGNFVQHPCNKPGDFNFYPQIRYYCCDLDDQYPLYVQLRYMNSFGNASFCVIPISVADSVKPVILCPNEYTLQCSLPFTSTGIDTSVTCLQPNITIPQAQANSYPMTIEVLDIPDGAVIIDVDLYLNIDHELVNQLAVTLYSPLNRKAMLITSNSCIGQPVQVPSGMNVTLNDQAYDINWFNQTGLFAPANFTCTSAKPSIGAFNQGHMKPQGDELRIFNGISLNNCKNKNLCFSAGLNDINAATNRISNFQVQLFIQDAGLIPGDRLLMEYASTTGTSLGGIQIGGNYLFQVINNNTIEFLTITGDDITSVPAGSSHMFCGSSSWLLVVEDTAPLGGGYINEVCLHIAYMLNTGLKPEVTDNSSACGLTVTHEDLQDPGSCPSNTQIDRQWTVTDKSGNSSSCIQKILIKDLTDLIVQFPNDVSIACTDYQNLSVAGDVRHNGDCEQVSVTHTDSLIIHSGEYDKILRTWIIKDDCRFSPDGSPDIVATQIQLATNTITFSPNLLTLINALNLIKGDRFIMQYSNADIPITGLEIGQLYNVRWIDSTDIRFENNAITHQPVTFANPGNGPHLFNYANSDLGVALTCEELFNLAPCLDWDFACTDGDNLFANDGDGYFSYTQHITLTPPTEPQWADCLPEEYCSYDADCLSELIALSGQPLDPCFDASNWTYSWQIDFDQDGTIDIEGTGEQTGGTYPIGVHQIAITATNQLGFVTTCSKTFSIRDCAPPVPVCLPGISVVITPASGGIITVSAQEFEAGLSSDNCTLYDDLDLRLQRSEEFTSGDQPPPNVTNSLVFSCMDIPQFEPSAMVYVVVWVGDASGNWDYCFSNITLLDDHDVCKQNINMNVHITTENFEGVALADIEVTGTYPISGIKTDNNGTAYLGGAPFSGEYTVTPYKDINPLNGVSTYDLLLIQRHLLSIKKLNSPYKLIAADVNNSCHVSVADMFALRKMILQGGTSFVNNTSWRFVDAEYIFPNPYNPCNFPEHIYCSPLNKFNFFFIGIKIGDVSDDANPHNLLEGDTRNTSGTLYFSIDNESFTAGSDLEVLVRATDFEQLYGYQYSLDFDPEVLSFVALEPVCLLLSEENFGLHNTANGQITTSWHDATAQTLENDEVLYRLRFRTLKDGTVQQTLKLNNRILHAEAYTEHDDLLEVKFHFMEDELIGNKFKLFQNVPNPYHSQTDIRFYLPEDGHATFKLFDATGICLNTINGYYSKGYHSVTVLRSELPGSGMYFYQLHTNINIATKSMILTE